MLGNLRRAFIACLVLVAWPGVTLADVAVIVHRDNPVQTANARMISDLYLGRVRSLVSDEQSARTSVLLYDQPVDSPVREAFFQLLNGMGVRQVNAYWARLRFSGEVLPPIALEDSRAIIAAVARNRNAIGYVDAATVNESVKVVLHLKR